MILNPEIELNKLLGEIKGARKTVSRLLAALIAFNIVILSAMGWLRHSLDNDRRELGDSYLAAVGEAGREAAGKPERYIGILNSLYDGQAVPLVHSVSRNETVVQYLRVLFYAGNAGLLLFAALSTWKMIKLKDSFISKATQNLFQTPESDIP